MANHTKPDNKKRTPVLVTIQKEIIDQGKKIAEEQEISFSRLVENILKDNINAQ
jgi:hypothetical protein